MRHSNQKVHVEWGQLAFATFIAVVAAYYLYDITSVSMNINNIILVVPLTIIILGLYVVLAWKCVRVDVAPVAETAAPVEHEDPQMQDKPQTRGDMIRAAVLLAGVGVYVSFYQLIGLDVATFAFMVAAMFLLGVQGKVLIAVYASIFTVVVIGGAHLLLPYPMPMALF